MKTILLSIFVILSLFLYSCDNTQSDDTAGFTPKIDPEELKQCRLKSVGYINYELTLEGRWTESNFGGQTPAKIINNAHFSPFIVFAHKSNTSIFETGSKASSGMEKMAETGSTEIISLHDSDENIGCVVTGNGLNGGATQTITIPVNNSYNTITILSMLVPSSDWFVAKKIKLSKDDNALEDSNLPPVATGFKNNETENLNNYDAGTEQDTPPFNLGNTAETSHKDITRLGTPFATSDVLVRVTYKQKF